MVLNRTYQKKIWPLSGQISATSCLAFSFLLRPMSLLLSSYLFQRERESPITSMNCQFIIILHLCPFAPTPLGIYYNMQHIVEQYLSMRNVSFKLSLIMPSLCKASIGKFICNTAIRSGNQSGPSFSSLLKRFSLQRQGYSHSV